MLKRVTDRNKMLKVQRVMEWLFRRNMVYDAASLENSKTIQMSKKQLEKFTRNESNEGN